MRRSANRTASRLAAVACALLAACGPRPGTGRPGDLPPEAISGPPLDYAPGLAEGAGPHRGEPELDAAALPRDPAALPGSVVLWQRRPAEGFFGPGPEPVALWSAGNLLVAIDQDDDDAPARLVGLGLDDGAERWALPFAADDRYSERMPPVERDGMLYVSQGRAMSAIDLATGERVWRTELPGPVDGNGFVAADRLVVRTLDRPLQDPGDPDSLPDWRAPADTRIVALDRHTGAVAWSDTIAEDTSLWVTASHVVVGTWHSPPEYGYEAAGYDEEATGYDETATGYDDEAAGAGAETGGMREKQVVEEEPAGEGEAHDAIAPLLTDEYWTELTFYRLADGGGAGEARMSGYLQGGVAWRELLVVAEGTDDGTRTVLVARRVPSWDVAWRHELPTSNAALLRAGDELLVASGALLRRISAATGAAAAEADLSALLPPRPEWPDTAGWRPADCIGGMAVAGDSVAYATNESCASKHLVLLDGATLRPWRVSEGPTGMVQGLLADARRLVLAIPGGLVVVDVTAAGPSRLASTTFEQRVAEVAARIEQGQLPLGFPLDNEAKEFVLSGEAIRPAVRAALGSARPAERLFAATVLRYAPDPEAVPAMVEAFVPPPPLPYGGAFMGETPDPAQLQNAFLGRLLEALAVCGDARATELLAGVFADEATWSEIGRSYALQGLVAIGTPEALAKVDAYRESRTQRAEVWLPRAVEGTAGRRFDDAGFAGGEPGEPAPVDGPTRRTSDDGKVVAFVAYAAGGTSDLWLRAEAAGDLLPMFTGETSTYGLTIVAVEPTADGAVVTVRRVDEGPDCAICGMMGAMSGEPPPPEVEQRLTFSWAALRKDADGDGWSDLLEARLRTDPAQADTDGDGLADGLDPAPRGSGSGDPPPCATPPHTGCAVDQDGRRLDDGCRLCPEELTAAGCSRRGVLHAAFWGNFAFTPGDGPLFVEGPAETNLQYEGYPGPVIWLSEAEAEELKQQVGLDGATYFSFDQRREEGPDGEYHSVGSPLEQVEFSEDGARATINVTEFRGGLNAVGHRIELRCIEGRWYPLSIEMTWIS
jgi:outer membrane protein assembly factor BamB